MTDNTLTQNSPLPNVPKPSVRVLIERVDRVLWAIAVLFLGIAILDAAQIVPSLWFVLESVVYISPFLALSVATAAAAKASGADATIAQVFTGRPLRMIVVAALFGALSPFCSCGVIPVIAGLLGAGVPLAPVMAFWVSSPLMDPEMFILSTATLGLSFTVAKTISTIGIGLMAGFATHGIMAAGLLQNPLRGTALDSCSTSCGSAEEHIQWKFWKDADRKQVFWKTSVETGWFLAKWLVFAFVLESLMTAYVPASMIVDYLGSGNWYTVPLAVFASIPAYLNGYAAIPLMSRLMEMGMAPGAAMGFLLGGGITCIPAAVAVFVLVRRMVFVWYMVLAMIGAMTAAVLFQLSL
jgi:uncharacterized protein